MKVVYLLLLTLFLMMFDSDNSNQLLLDNCKKYGKQLAPDYRTRNCVQFLDALLKMQLKDQLTKEISQIIFINLSIEEVESNLNENDSTKVAGVCWALTKSKLGNWVSPNQLIPGDIVQYWNNVGVFTNGHCGVIKTIHKDQTFTIYSSHPDTRGFGEMKIEMPEYLFCVRLN